MHRLVFVLALLLAWWPRAAAAVDEDPPPAPNCRCETNQDCGGSGATCVAGRCSKPSKTCCQARFEGVNECSVGVASAATPTHRNILFVLADDIAYCHAAGFMVTRGVCRGPEVATESARLCSASDPCPSGETCQFELTCRHRKPGLNKDSGSFPYDRSSGTSYGTPVSTPFLDSLASVGAVFPRAHVAAAICTSSRQTFLTGRYQRHTKFLATAGDSKFECVDSASHQWPLPTAKACAAKTSSCEVSHYCGETRTIPTLLRDLAGYETLGSGKTEFNPAVFTTQKKHHSKKPQIGKFHCAEGCRGEETCDGCQSCTDCQDDLALVPPKIPTQAIDSIDEITDFIAGNFAAPTTTTLVTTTTTPTSTLPVERTQKSPFFIWYGPNIPHVGSTAEQYFRALYDAPAYAALGGPSGKAMTEKNHFARISWMDFGVRTVVDQLETTCACSAPDGNETQYGWKSVYDNTVVIYAGGDQGFLMPKAKHTYTENTHRMVLIVSEPAHRRSSARLEPRAFPDQFAATPDVLQTVLAYAGITEPYPYEFGKNLKPWVSGTKSPSEPIRKVQFSEQGASNIPNNGGAQYLINQSGRVGVCRDSKRPCIHDLDCGATDDCRMPDVDDDGRRCVNRPDVACTDDADCSQGAALCVSNACAHVEGVSYRDFETKPCSVATAGADCLPAGVCKPTMLKVVASPGTLGIIRAVWDLNHTPDQLDDENILKSDPAYIGGTCIKAEIDYCLKRFRDYPDVPSNTTPGPPSGCPAFSWCPPS